MTRTLVFIIGPPAVGKMTVGRALERITGFPLFHNHMSIEPVLPFFAFDSPPFTRLVANFREQIFREMAASDHRGLIFTFSWAFGDDDDRAFVDATKAIFEAHGGRTVFAELYADLDTRLQRNATEPRLTEKPSKRDIAASSARLVRYGERYRLNSAGDFPFPADHLRIDNTKVSAEEAARRIADHFGLFP
jgi:hypothetical protein